VDTAAANRVIRWRAKELGWSLLDQGACWKGIAYPLPLFIIQICLGTLPNNFPVKRDGNRIPSLASSSISNRS
jgi:hypothetical protein